MMKKENWVVEKAGTILPVKDMPQARSRNIQRRDSFKKHKTGFL